MFSRLGLFGGTFDPVHYGHLRTIEAARIELNLSRVLLLPNPLPPHKLDHDLTPYHHRKEMLRLALNEFPHLELSEFEEQAAGPAYTTDTVRRIMAALPEDKEIWLIVGADSLLDLPKWKDPEALFRDAYVAVLPRPGFDLSSVQPDYLNRVHMLTSPQVDISATDIRHRLALGEATQNLLPASVLQYIIDHRLYST